MVGLLNFHLPHFLLEPGKATGLASAALEVVLLANVVAAVVAAVGTARGRAWGRRLGAAVAVFSVLLWLAQETIGLPGLPRRWGEPSRLLALLLEAAYLALARAALGRVGPRAPHDADALTAAPCPASPHGSSPRQAARPSLIL